MQHNSFSCIHTAACRLLYRAAVMTAREPDRFLDEQEVSLAARLCCARRITLVRMSQTLWRAPECCFAQSCVSIYRVGIGAAVSGSTGEPENAILSHTLIVSLSLS